MEKKNIIKIGIGVVVVVILGGGYFISKAASASKAKNAVKYTTLTAQKGTIAVNVQATGSVSAAISDDITSSNNGIISGINVKEGEIVKKGQIIGSINDTSLQQSVNLAQLKVQQDNTDNANSNTTLQQSVTSAQLKVQQDNNNIGNNKTTSQQSVNAAQQSVNAAQIKVQQDNTNIAKDKSSKNAHSNSDQIKNDQTNLEKDQTNLKKDETNLKKNQENLNNAITQLADANGANNSSYLQLQQDQADLNTKTTQLNEIVPSSNNVQLQQDQTDLNNKTAQLADQTVTSPINGVIVTINFNNGDTVQSGKIIATVVDMNSLQIAAQVDELDIAKVAKGQKAAITFDALTGKTYTGTVTKVSQLGTTTSGVTDYPVYISIDNPSGIKIGMNANINIIVASKSNIITLALDAIQSINGKKYVMTSTQTNTSGTKTTNTSNMKEVTTGLTNPTDVEIVSGLKDGDTVYVKLTTAIASETSQSGTSGTTSSTGTTSFRGVSGSGYGGGSARGGN